MPASPLAVDQFQLDTPVYCQKGDLVGRLRLVLADEEAPYAVQSIVIDRGSRERNVSVPVSAITKVEPSKIFLSIASDVLPELPEYAFSQRYSNQRDYRDSYKRTRRLNNRRPYGNRQRNQ